MGTDGACRGSLMVFLWCFWLGLVPINHGASSYQPSVLVGTGQLRGRFWETRDNRTIEAFLGIPYAKPPLGELRFEPPQPAESWDGVRDANKMPPACTQNNIDYGPTSEDCLYLNVFTRNTTVDPLLPVMVWVYGGGLEFGAICSYTPEYLMDEDIVFVTIQYRVGLFGFLSTNDKVMPGNQGLKDVRLGLRWVQDHIHHFGGDPRKVTLAGHSSGGAIVHALMLFSAHEGLFRAGITQSGTSLLSIAFQPPGEIGGVLPVLARLASCPPDSAGLVLCLKQKTSQEVVDLWKTYKMTKLFGVFTDGDFPLTRMVIEPECVQDKVITRSPWDMRVTVPWIVGVNSHEGLILTYPLVTDRSNILFSLLNTFYDEVFSVFANYPHCSFNYSGVPAATRAFYLDNRPITRETFPQLSDIFSDAIFVYGLFESVLRGDVSKTFVYVNEYIGAHNTFKAPAPKEYLLGADHRADTAFFFPHNDNITDDRAFSADEDKVSKRFVKLWANFVKDLNPSPNDAAVQWPSFGLEQTYLNVTLDTCTLNQGFFPERMKFWQNQPFVYRDDELGPMLCQNTSAR